MSDKLVQAWYHGHWALSLLAPLAALYRLITAMRRWAYQHQILATARFSVPVIVVGNITVGGTGKTPLTLALVEFLRQHGYRPAVVSRGYGGQTTYPALVTDHSLASEVGDEPLLIYQQSRVPVVVAPKRAQAVAWLVEHKLCDVVLCDDGLQHYALHRDIEIVVIDGERGLGNGKLLPQGPLREAKSRLQSVDLTVVNGQGYQGDNTHTMRLVAGAWQPVGQTTGQPPQAPQKLHALAGIGNPQRFFSMLAQQGFEVATHAFPDHHAFVEQDLRFNDSLPIVMTSKDAVKCQHFAKANVWQVPVVAELDTVFFQQLLQKLQSVRAV